tara:strand:- start:434 stop:544 length:111 start_codon:yes stop_codon:yes gene_type:complete
MGLEQEWQLNQVDWSYQEEEQKVDKDSLHNYSVKCL